jgi:hypothetical protein
VSAGVEDVSVTNVRLGDAAAAVRLKTKCGRGASVRNVRFENISAETAWYALWIDQEYNGSSPTDRCNATGTTLFEGVTVRNLSVQSASEAAFAVAGLQGPPGKHLPLAVRDVNLSLVAVARYQTVGTCSHADVHAAADVLPAFPACSSVHGE